MYEGLFSPPRKQPTTPKVPGTPVVAHCPWDERCAEGGGGGETTAQLRGDGVGENRLLESAREESALWEAAPEKSERL